MSIQGQLIATTRCECSHLGMDHAQLLGECLAPDCLCSSWQPVRFNFFNAMVSAATFVLGALLVGYCLLWAALGPVTP